MGWVTEWEWRGKGNRLRIRESHYRTCNWRIEGWRLARLGSVPSADRYCIFIYNCWGAETQISAPADEFAHLIETEADAKAKKRRSRGRGEAELSEREAGRTAHSTVATNKDEEERSRGGWAKNGAERNGTERTRQVSRVGWNSSSWYEHCRQSELIEPRCSARTGGRFPMRLTSCLLHVWAMRRCRDSGKQTPAEPPRVSLLN